MCAGSFPSNVTAALPIIDIKVNGKHARALVDTGCSKTIVTEAYCDECSGEVQILTVNGSKIKCEGEFDALLDIRGVKCRTSCIVSRTLLSGIGVILGIDAINFMGGVFVSESGVKFTKTSACVVAVDHSFPRKKKIEDKDFVANFDGTSWKVRWLWNDSAPVLRNCVACYEGTLSDDNRKPFEEQIELWIENGGLVPCDDVTSGVLPLMAVNQPSKKIVRPVLNYRELNRHVKSHTGDYTPVCDETIRKWRQMTGNFKIADLRNAYLQIEVDESLWQHQVVNFRGNHYYLTRLGFGLNCAPRIMTRILGEVLQEDKELAHATDHYIDDIIVNEDVAPVEKVIEHLRRYGLETKPPEPLETSCVLGLQLSSGTDGEIVFRRGKELPECQEDREPTRREVFSICGKLTGHYPVAGWLRVACSYLKRSCEGSSWDDGVGHRGWTMLKYLLSRVKSEDPVRGRTRKKLLFGAMRATWRWESHWRSTATLLRTQPGCERRRTWLTSM